MEQKIGGVAKKDLPPHTHTHTHTPVELPSGNLMCKRLVGREEDAEEPEVVRGLENPPPPFVFEPMLLPPFPPKPEEREASTLPNTAPCESVLARRDAGSWKPIISKTRLSSSASGCKSSRENYAAMR